MSPLWHQGGEQEVQGAGPDQPGAPEEDEGAAERQTEEILRQAETEETKFPGDFCSGSTYCNTCFF